MSSQETLFLLFVCYLPLCYNKVEGNYILSKEEDLEMERQLQLLNKPAIKIIKNKYGDIYDCVDFYKQLAFHHPSIKNYTYEFQMRQAMKYNERNTQKSSGKTRSLHIDMDIETCPPTTVPIRRIKKDELVRERQAVEARKTKTPNRPGTFLAVARTSIASGLFAGVEAVLSLHNPKVFGQQFSTTRIKIQKGDNSIEAGWRVDPSLYGDTHTRFFIRTDVGRSHCFNTRCPGFVQTYHGITLDHVFSKTTVLGGPPYTITIKIMRDSKTGHWNLLIGHNAGLFMGFWPSNIFSGLTGLADYIEWGGAAYSPPGTPLPPMGSGIFFKGNTGYDAYISNITVTNDKGKTFDARYLQTYTDDPARYYVMDLENQKHYGRMISYGGPGNAKV